jgi:hypothetical protein
MCKCSGVLGHSNFWAVKFDACEKDLFDRLHHFYHRFVLAMCRISLALSIQHHLSSTSLLFRRLVMELFDNYYNHRLLRRAGRIARMTFTRVPRGLLSCWVRSLWPLGCQVKLLITNNAFCIVGKFWEIASTFVFLGLGSIPSQLYRHHFALNSIRRP